MLLRVCLSQTVARSMSAAWCPSQSGSRPNCSPIHVSRMLLLAECTPPNRYLIYVSRIMLLAECVSAKPWPDPCQPHAVARRVHPAKSVPDLRQPHDIAPRVRLGQTVARFMSAACCCSQSTSRPNRGPIHVSRMLLLAECTPPNRYLIYVGRMILLPECVSAKPLPDSCQPHFVARRVRLGQTVARSMSAACCCSQSAPRQIGTWSTSAAWCCSQSVSQLNHCSIYVSCMMLLAECVSAKPLLDLRQPHSVARSAAQSMSVVWCCSQSASQPNRCPIHVSHIVSLAVLSDLRQPHSVIRRVVQSTSAT